MQGGSPFATVPPPPGLYSEQAKSPAPRVVSRPRGGGRQQRARGTPQPPARPPGLATSPSPSRGGGSSSSRRQHNTTPSAKPEQRFPAYLGADDVERGAASGALFVADLRCNPGNRDQAFCTVPGVPHDVFIPGCLAQNRAIEGDRVAIRILPLAQWHSKDKNARPPVPAGDAARMPVAQGNVKAFNRRALQRHVTPPAWSRPAAPSSDNDLVASPALLPSASGGELAFALDASLATEEEGGNDVDDALCSSAAANGAAGDEGDDGAGSMVAFLTAKVGELTTATTPAPAAQEAAPPPASPAPPPAAPWLAAGTPQAAAAAIAALMEGQWQGWRATGEVVAIVSPSPRRQSVVGVLLPGSTDDELLLAPCNPRLPQLRVPVFALPAAHSDALLVGARAPDGAARTLVSGAIVSWGEGDALPAGEVREVIGEAGGLEVEVRALLMMERVDDDDQFSPEVLACLPEGPWAVDDAEAAARRDFRGVRVFSIDPPTARDLDDALSVEKIVGAGGEALLRIGVHIADVSHFVRPGTALDAEAAARSTSVYLVDRVIPMLPRPLCEELCSLNPGVDRLAFSCVWDLTPEGDIRDTWVGRTVIRSCAKLSYLAVQEMIEGRYTGVAGQGPPLGAAALHGPWAWADVVADSLALRCVAASLRRRRFEERGALRLDNVRLGFQLDAATGQPVSFEAYEQREANQLVEEFMLLANMTTAGIVSAAFPDRAVLRCHPTPNQHKMQELAATVAHLLPGAPPLDVSSAGALHASLAALRSAVGGSAVAEVVTLLCTKPMPVASYFCTGDRPDPRLWRHYALAVEHYTHFTSPIRRYPDIMVHRLLAAAIDAGKVPPAAQVPGTTPLEPEAAAERHGLRPLEAAAAVAAHANDRKTAAKAVQDGCLRLYLTTLLLDCPRVCQGVVINLGGPRFFDVYVPTFGIDVRVHTEQVLVGGEEALQTSWNAKSKTLLLMRKPKMSDARPACDELCGGGGEGPSNAGGVARMPLGAITLSPLCTVAVLVGAQRSRTTGSPAGIHARLWVQ